ncbi:MAG: MFS transporter [Verrucomicrobiota bacterium]
MGNSDFNLPPRAARLAVAATFFFNGALFATWVSRIPALKEERGLSHGMLGLALLMIALGAVVAMPLAGRFTARLGSRRVTQVTAALMSLALPLLVLAPNGPWFVLALFCFGAVHGALDVSMNTQAVAVEKRYGRPINSGFHALFSFGGLIGSAVGGLVASAGIAPLGHFIVAVVVLGGTTALFALPRLLDAGEAEAHGKLDEARPEFAWPKPALLALGALAFFVMMGEGAMADWSAVFLRQATGASEGLAAAGYAAFSITMAIGRFSGDWLSTRFGPVTLVRLSGSIATLGMALALFSPSPMTGLIGFACVGAGFATVVPMAFTAAGRTPGVSAGVALATASTIGYFGFLLGPPLIGFAAELIGLRGALALILVTSALIVALAPVVRQAASIRPSAKQLRETDGPEECLSTP